MPTKKVLLSLFLILIIAASTWLSLLYHAYGKQTLLFLVQSSPMLIWSYSKAIVVSPGSDEAKGKGLFNNGALERPTASLPPIASKHMIAKMSHAYQKLNNCGPSTALMAASTYGIIFDQFFAADRLKGGPTDKNVGPPEMIEFLESQGLQVAYRLNGNAAVIEQLVSRDIPVIVEQWLVKRGSGELVGHYRVVRGYDQNSQLFTTNDSFNGPNFVIPYGQFDEWWRPFNRTYLVVYKAEQENIVKDILGADWDEELNAEGGARVAQAEIESVGDGYAYFNLGSSYTHLHKFTEAKSAYDRALATTFPPFFLWYQFGPLEAYYQTGQYDRVLSMTEELFRSAGDGEEGHYYRSLVFAKQGKTAEAKIEQEKTSAANPNFIPPFK